MAAGWCQAEVVKREREGGKKGMCVCARRNQREGGGECRNVKEGGICSCVRGAVAIEEIEGWYLCVCVCAVTIER